MPKEARGINEKTGLSGAEHQKAEQRAAIDAQTSAAILAGFSYEVEGEALHFSYDSFDQQNFSDTANACLMYKSGAKGFAGKRDVERLQGRRGACAPVIHCGCFSDIVCQRLGS